MVYPKLYVGAMSKTIIEIVCSYSQERGTPLGLVASRRQIDGHKAGYVGWDIIDLRRYLRDKPGITLERDHGGPCQSDDNDDGYQAMAIDSQFVDIIHVDVWKTYKEVDQAVKATADYIRYCLDLNEFCKFEVGTEEGIRPYSAEELEMFLNKLYVELGADLFNTIIYAVIQSGTRIKGMTNIGIYDPDRLKAMIKICRDYSLLSKEHNADYLPVEKIKERFDCGLSALNIAPQIASIENECNLLMMSEEQKKELLDRCLKSKQLSRWFGDVTADSVSIMKALAHYFRGNIRFQDISMDVYYATKNRLYDLFDTLLKKQPSVSS